ASPHIFKARVYLAKKDQEAARKELQKALELEAGNKDAMFMFALIAEGAQDWASARGWYEKWLQTNRNDTVALLALYGMEMRAGQTDRAVATLERATGARPEIAAPAVVLGNLYMRYSRPQQALDVTSVAVQRDPKNLGLLDLRGAAYM